MDKHDVALKALEEAETQCQPFRSFITNIYALNTVRGQTLRSFLIMPGAPPASALRGMHSLTHMHTRCTQSNVCPGTACC